MRRQTRALKEVVTEQELELRLLKKYDQQIFDAAQAQGEAEVEPNRLLNDRWWDRLR